jgi:hypothetical protein
MKFPAASKIEMAACTDESRESIARPYLDVDKKIIAASNGCIAVVMPVQIDEGDTSGHLDSAALVEARKIAGRKAETVSLRANGQYALPNGMTIPRSQTETPFPDMEQYMARELTSDTSGDVVHICLNVDYLVKIAAALGAGKNAHLNLDIKPEIVTRSGRSKWTGSLNPIAVTCDTSEGYAVIMPARRGEK